MHTHTDKTASRLAGDLLCTLLIRVSVYGGYGNSACMHVFATKPPDTAGQAGSRPDQNSEQYSLGTSIDIQYIQTRLA